MKQDEIKEKIGMHTEEENISEKESLVDEKKLQYELQEIIPSHMESSIKIQESTKRMLEPLQPIVQIQTNMGLILETFRKAIAVPVPTMDQIQEISNVLNGAFSIKYDFSEFSEVAHKITEIISESIQKTKIPSISEERKKKYIETYRLWGSYGWTVNPCINAKTMFVYVPSDKKNADNIALKQCSGKKMEDIFGTISETKRVKKADFEESVFDYKHKQYKSCALILFSLIDATLIRLQKKSDLGGRRREVGLCAVNKAKKRTEADTNTELLFMAVFYTNLFSCLEKVFEGGKDFKKQPNVINRNFLDHGMLTRKVTRKDCIQLFLLYYNMLELLDIIY